MKPIIFALSKLAVLLVLLGTPIATWAKSPTTEITLSGGGLGRVVEVTDPKLLAMSNVWLGQFLDPSRSPLNEGPPGLKAYEVSFYVKLAENDVRKMYVAYYYPNVGSEQGLIYLPDKGAVWELNIGTIIRGGQGKWNYVLPAWEALIKPVIANAEAAPALTSESTTASEATGSQNQKVSGASEVATGGWTRPKRGWLYVLDPRSESDHPGSRVWLVDPKSAKVMGSIRAGSDPDFALSPDGTRLYVASGERESGELAAIDTATGAVKRFPFPDRILYKPWYEALPPFSPMVVSSDGAVRILVHRLFSPEKIGYQLWTFDTTNGRFLSAHIGLGNCGYGQFVLSATANEFDFLCPTDEQTPFHRTGRGLPRSVEHFREVSLAKGLRRIRWFLITKREGGNCSRGWCDLRVECGDAGIQRHRSQWLQPSNCLSFRVASLSGRNKSLCRLRSRNS